MLSNRDIDEDDAPIINGDAPGDGLGAIKATVQVTVPMLTAAGSVRSPRCWWAMGPSIATPLTVCSAVPACGSA